MKFWKRVSAPLLILGLASPALVNCDALGGLGVPGTSCPALKDGNFGALKFEGDADVQGKITTFLESAYTLNGLSAQLELDLIESCAVIGKSMNMPAAELEAEASGGDGAKKVCGAVQAKMGVVFNASAGVSLDIDIQQPRCEVPIEAMNACLESCGAVIDPGQLEASCEGGEVSGSCEAECTGTCVVEAGVECKGSCGGDCSGKCDGKNASGHCEGTCEGTCSSTCDMKAQVDCKGQCQGGCSAKLKAPSCTGTYKPPSVSADCHAGCVTKTANDVKCYPPGVAIKINGTATAEVEGLVVGLKEALPKIAQIQLATGKRIGASAEQIVKQAADIPKAASKAGLQAVTCVGQAGDMVIGASASISVSVEVSASVSGSASGSASGG